jgi:VanZ family protein
MKSLLASIWPSIIWTIIIFVLLVIPTNGVETTTAEKIPNLDKLVHFLLFAGFSFFWHIFLLANYTFNRTTLFLTLLAISFLYGYGMELVQKNFTLREFSMVDAYADGIGALLGLLIKKSPYGNRGRNQN